MRVVWLATWFALVLTAGAARAQAEPSVFKLEDLERFGRAYDAIQAGQAPEAALGAYVAAASPGLQGYQERYDLDDAALTAAIARNVAAKPRFYDRLRRLGPRIEAMKPQIDAGLARLDAMVPAEIRSTEPTPVYFYVANAYAGGIQVDAEPGDPTRRALALSLETLGFGPDVDMSEFPNGRGGAVTLDDIPYVAVHEMVHVYQLRMQGLANYVSIYMDGTRGDNLAVALREGCADHLTWLAVGKRRENLQAYGAEHEAELWAEFRQIMHEPGFSVPGWYDGGDPARPERPSQIGYWMGMAICRTFHESAADKDAALRQIIAAYRPEDFRRIAAPYIARHGGPNGG